MKMRIALLLVAACWLTSFRVPDIIDIGAKLPKGDVKMKDVSGKEVSMNDAKKAGGLLVMFSCNTCPYVVRNQERTRKICQYALKNNIGVIIINSNEAQRGDGDSFEAMQRYAKVQNYTWNYVLDKDNAIADAFAADRTPECYLFNKNSVLVYKGAIDDNPGNASAAKQAYLQMAIDVMLEGKSPNPATTASVGCGIKRKI